MRIAIFQDTYHPCTNGVVVSTNLFIDELKRRGHETLLVAPRHATYEDAAPEDVHLIDAVSTDWIYPDSSLGKPWKARLGRKLETFQPHLIHSMTEFSIGHWLASHHRRKLGLKRVHTFHTLWSEYLFYVPLLPQAISQPAFRWLVPRLCRKRFDAIVVPSEAMAETVRDDWGVNVPVSVVPTGLELEQFSTGVGTRFREQYEIRPGEKMILYLGRLGDEKNVELVVETMAELRRRGEANLRLVIAGGGPDLYIKKLRKRAAALGLDDTLWTGFISGQQWLDCYAAADLMLFPSLTETQGLVVIEALASGLPMVSVKSMGPGSIMKGEKGCLFADSDAVEFADKAQRFLHDEVFMERKRREAMEVARSFSVEQRGAELEVLYMELLGEKPPREVVQPRRRAAVSGG